MTTPELLLPGELVQPITMVAPDGTVTHGIGYSRSEGRPMTSDEFFLLRDACSWARQLGLFLVFWRNYRLFRDGGESIVSSVEGACFYCDLMTGIPSLDHPEDYWVLQ